MTITELQEKRLRVATDIRKMAADFDKAGNSWSANDEAKFNKLTDEHDAIVSDLMQAERVASKAKAVEEFDSQPDNPHGIGYSYGNEPQLSAGRVPGADGTSDWLQGPRGERVPLVKPEQSYASAMRAAGADFQTHGDVGLGDFMASLATGARSASERNALGESTPAGGGVTVPTRLASQLIDLMRDRTQVIAAGARTIPLDTEKTVFATLESDPTAGWRNELGPVADSDPTFGSLTFTARSLAFKVSVSEELLEDSVNVRAELPRVMATVMAQEVDRVALAGSGVAPEPRGVLNLAGLPTEDLATPEAPITDYQGLLRAIELLNGRNHYGTFAAIMHTTNKSQLDALVDSTGQPLRRPPVLENLPMLPTNRMPIDEVSAAPNLLRSIIVGDFSNLAIGIRHNVRVSVLADTLKDNLTYTYVIRLRMDVQAFRVGAFQRIKNIVSGSP